LTQRGNGRSFGSFGETRARESSFSEEKETKRLLVLALAASKLPTTSYALVHHALRHCICPVNEVRATPYKTNTSI
jgi:hypothetical protein